MAQGRGKVLCMVSGDAQNAMKQYAPTIASKIIMSANAHRLSVAVKRLAHLRKTYKVPDFTKTYLLRCQDH
jgi:hypothetical protein